MIKFHPARPVMAMLACGVLLAHTAPSALAAPVTSDGASVSGLNFGTLEDVANLVIGANRLETAFARTASFGDLITMTETLRDGLPGNADVARLLAAAHAASGDSATAQALLDVASQTGRTTTGPWAAIAESLIARHDGDLDLAAANAAKAIAADPDNAYARNVAGAAAAAADDLELAVSHFSAAVERGPESAVYVANLGATLAALGDDRLARTALRRALDLDPDNCVGLIAASELAVEQSAALLDRCLAAQPGHPAATPRLIDALIRREDFDAARAVATAHESGLDAPNVARARIELHAGATDEARRYVTAMPSGGERALFAAYVDGLAGDPARGAVQAADAFRAGALPGGAAHLAMSAAAGVEPDPQIALALADRPDSRFFAALAAGGKTGLDGTDGATAALRMAGLDAPGALDQQDLRGALVLGVLWRNHGLAVPARTAFAAAVDADPNSALAHFLLGMSRIEAAQPDVEGALLAFDAAISASPRFAAAHRAKAEVLARGGAFDEARTHLVAAMDVEDGAIDRLSAGAMAEAMGDDAAARADYERAVELAPEFFAALNQLAWFLAERDVELDRARALAERAEALQPENASILDTLGWVRFKQGDADGALNALRRAHDIDGGSRPEITLRLAELEATAGNSKRAEALLESVIALGGPSAELARARLQDQDR